MKDELLNYIFKKSPMQQKKISRYLQENSDMDADLSRFLATYRGFIDAVGISYIDLAESYLQMVEQMMEARLYFARTGAYPVNCQDETVQNIYSDNQVMTKYMLGLALSQFLWKHHYLIFSYYRSQIDNHKPKGNYLEVGSGHGLYAVEILHHFPCDAFDIVDISETSLSLTNSILQVIHPGLLNRVNFVNADINLFRPTQQYDFITVGEVLEHVADPLKMLRHLKSLLKPEGKLFVTTCVNSPAIDHIYYFKSVDEITDLITLADLRICDQLIVPSEDKSPELIAKLKMDVLYAAILENRRV